jgi:glycine betaine/proline transport system ATP-binding protein
MAKIRVEHLTKIFNGHVKQVQTMLTAGKSKQQILEKTGATIGVNDANFSVQGGEIFVIMGLSGSGKSTLIRMINRLIEPTSGHVYLDGQDIAKLSKDELQSVRRKKMSMVFQNFPLFPHRNVLENTAYGLEIQGVDVDKRHARAADATQRSVDADGGE